MKKIVILALVAVLAVSLAGCGQEAVEEEKETYIAVEVESAQKQDIYVENIFSGNVYADKDVYVMPKIVGKVEEVRVSVGDVVEEDDILFILNEEDIQNQVDQARAGYNSALANYERTKEQIENAKDAFERTKELYEEGAVSKAEYDQAKLAASDKSLKAVQAQVDQARVGYNQAMDALDNAEVKAPIGGTVTNVNIEEGEYATNSNPAVVLMDMENVKIVVNVTENIINKIYPGKEVTVEIEAVELVTDAEIETVSDSVNPQTGLYEVKIRVPNNQNIKSGMFASVTIPTDIRENVIAVPAQAVLQKDDSRVVYTVDGDQAVENIVETGLDIGDRVEITTGLSEGDQVIVKGQDYVSEGTTIKVVRGE
jgi:RND family efflux transporter MFP subunit